MKVAKVAMVIGTACWVMQGLLYGWTVLNVSGLAIIGLSGIVMVGCVLWRRT